MVFCASVICAHCKGGNRLPTSLGSKVSSCAAADRAGAALCAPTSATASSEQPKEQSHVTTDRVRIRAYSAVRLPIGTPRRYTTCELQRTISAARRAVPPFRGYCHRHRTPERDAGPADGNLAAVSRHRSTRVRAALARRALLARDARPVAREDG